nr:4Fe-4S binding protein [Chloroflexota bacterium]
MDADEPALIDLTRCNGCGDCIPACPYGAIALRSAHGPMPARRALQHRR